jgi:DNA repair protein RecO (recombination protein O)
MTCQFSGRLLTTTRYGDNSLILRFYTAEYGICSFMYRNPVKKAGKSNLPRYPLFLYELNTPQPDGNLKVLRGIQLTQNTFDVPNAIQCGVGTFIAELVWRTQQHAPADSSLFRLLNQTAEQLYDKPFHADVHLHFVKKMAHIMGIAPQPGNGSYFDLREACFQNEQPPHHDFLDAGDVETFRQALMVNASDNTFKTGAERYCAVQLWLRFFRTHVPEFGEMRSPEVLKELFI